MPRMELTLVAQVSCQAAGSADALLNPCCTGAGLAARAVLWLRAQSSLPAHLSDKHTPILYELTCSCHATAAGVTQRHRLPGRAGTHAAILALLQIDLQLTFMQDLQLQLLCLAGFGSLSFADKGCMGRTRKHSQVHRSLRGPLRCDVCV